MAGNKRTQTPSPSERKRRKIGTPEPDHQSTQSVAAASSNNSTDDSVILLTSESAHLSGSSNAQKTEAAEISVFKVLSPIPGLQFSRPHHDMDEAIMKKFRPMLPGRPPHQLIIMLELLEKYPALSRIADSCFDSGSFKDLRELEIFWQKISSVSDEMTTEVLG
ncbi:hypothetical protein A0H81_10903 [Grifola frondosa]|uniref:Uncharacterized protein n=1 Tax=Grifola frondosa TaxID=5627 RepID=A0A1C7LXC8_GRIFR|nr:hypothetical protein A0H81_10903 [Grifola frondosa]